jgi:transposase
MPFIGIDVSKETLDIYNDTDSHVMQVRNQETAIDDLVAYLHNVAPQQIVLEATGGYERLVYRTLKRAKLPVVRVNPRQVRDFAKACGILAKTDTLDARVLAQYARVIRPAPRTIDTRDDLLELLRLKRQLTDTQTREKNHLTQAHDPFVREELEDSISTLATRIARIDKELQTRLQDDDTLSAKQALLPEISGIGLKTQHLLLVALPELGHLTGKEIASLVGVAPKNRDSGQMRGKRIIWGGRTHVRTGLYMATLCATRYFEPIATFYKRLRATGKAAKVALTACMRKLLVILNAKMRDHLKTS